MGLSSTQTMQRRHVYDELLRVSFVVIKSTVIHTWQEPVTFSNDWCHIQLVQARRKGLQVTDLCLYGLEPALLTSGHRHTLTKAWATVGKGWTSRRTPGTASKALRSAV